MHTSLIFASREEPPTLRRGDQDQHYQRRRSVSWGRSETPPHPRDPYSNRQERDQPDTSYHQSRKTTYNPNYTGRGGRGGRGRRRGRGGRGSQHQATITRALETYQYQQVNQFVFCADPTKPAWLNQINFIKCLPTEALSIITNHRCHNYCDPPSLVPQTLKSLLGLGLKYCIKYPRPTNKVSKTVDRFKNDVRRTYFFKYHAPPDDDPHDTKYIPGLYISAEWEAPECPDKEAEKALSRFESSIIETRGKCNKNNPANL